MVFFSGGEGGGLVAYTILPLDIGVFHIPFTLGCFIRPILLRVQLRVYMCMFFHLLIYLNFAFKTPSIVN